MPAPEHMDAAKGAEEAVALSAGPGVTVVRKAMMLWWMLRPWNMAQAVAWGLAGAVLGVAGAPPVGRTLAAIVLVFVGYSTGQWANDIIDVEADRVNNPQRPLPSGAISVREVALAYAVANLIAVVAAFLMSPWAGLLALASLPLPVMYTKLKSYGIVGTLVMGVCCSAAVAFSSLLVAGVVPEVVWHVMAGVVLFDINLNTMAACGDVEGDRREGVRTLAVRIGIRRALAVAIAGQLGSLAVAFGPALRGLLHWQYLPLVVAVELVALGAVVWLYARPGRARVYQAGRIIKAMFLAHTVTFAAGFLPALTVVVPVIVGLELMTLALLRIADRAGVLSL